MPALQVPIGSSATPVSLGVNGMGSFAPSFSLPAACPGSAGTSGRGSCQEIADALLEGRTAEGPLGPSGPIGRPFRPLVIGVGRSRHAGTRIFALACLGPS